MAQAYQERWVLDFFSHPHLLIRARMDLPKKTRTRMITDVYSYFSGPGD